MVCDQAMLCVIILCVLCVQHFVRAVRIHLVQVCSMVCDQAVLCVAAQVSAFYKDGFLRYFLEKCVIWLVRARRNPFLNKVMDSTAQSFGLVSSGF